MTRKVCLDIAKGLGIGLVVLGHLIDYFGAEISGVYSFIYLFHVPLFFFLSGMFFKREDSFRFFLKKKFIRLYVPYLLANIFFFAVEIIRIGFLGDSYDGCLSWKDLIEAMIGLWPVLSMLSRPTWFLLILFRVSVIYCLVHMAFKGNKNLMIVVCLLVGILAAVSPIDDYMIGQTLTALPFFSIGHFCTPGFVDNRRLFSTSSCIALSVLSVLSLIILSRYQATNVAVNCYGNVLWFFTGAFVGIMLTLCVSKLLENSVIARSISFVGRYTLSILVWHVFLIKALFTIHEKIVGLPGGVMLFVIAFFTGVYIPVCMSLGYNKLKLYKKS